MTKVQIRFKLQRPLDDDLLAHLPKTHSVYGIQMVKVNADNTLTVEYDATRMKPTEVEAVFTAAGIPVVM